MLTNISQQTTIIIISQIKFYGLSLTLNKIININIFEDGQILFYK